MVGLEVDAPPRHVRALIDDVVAVMQERLDESASEVGESIHRHVDGLSDDLFLATRQSTRANLGLITTMLGEGAQPTGFSAPEEALSYARGYVHEGLSLEQLTRSYRQGQKSYSRMWLQELGGRTEDAGDLAVAMGYFSDWLFSYIEAINYPLSEVYTAEHERWVRGGVAMRSEEVRSILAGTRVNVTEASGRLRYRLEGRHLGFVIWADETETGEVGIGDGYKLFGEMDSYAGEVAAALGATSSLSLPIGRYYAGWACVKDGVDCSSIPDGSNGLHVAIGRVGKGLDGFRRTHAEALQARKVASLFPRTRKRCTTFDAIALDALMTQDIDEARRFVASELGALLDDSDANRRLAATLEVFLHEESSFVRAARRLGIHENTVAYRVRRAEELLGRKTNERQLELRTALRLSRFGTAATS
ncbi:MAG: hypothetical protein QOF76_5172 [Solirubrobacteraceae bacterium]|jgi:hypothetical protein|nr:hypothetical protein [Solirubrobacteraceae bacterium]